MNTLQIRGNWQIIKGKVRQHYARLTDDAQQYAGGKEVELVGRILKQSGMGPEESEPAHGPGRCTCGCSEETKERES